MTAANEYRAKGKSGFSDKDARVIGPELARLADEGRTTAPEVVTAALHPSSPLHGYFEWDDAKAATDWREAWARHMMASIVVRVIGADGEAHEVRAFHPVKVIVRDQADPPRFKSYLPISVIQADPDLAAQVVEEAHAQLIGWRNRYQTYRSIFPTFGQRYAPVFEAIEEVEQTEMEMGTAETA